MGKVGKSLAIALILVMAISGVSLLMVKPASAQTPSPSPVLITSQYTEFTLKFVYSSYNETTTNPYTGVNVTQQISNNTIEVSIKNQPWFYNGVKYDLSYNIRTKGHFETDNWTLLYSNPDPSANGGIPPSDSGYSVVSYPIENYPPNAQIDFSVQAFAWNFSAGYYPDGRYYSLSILVGESNWSNTQTLTIPASSTSTSSSPTSSQAPTSTPTAPEFPIIAIPLLLSPLSVAVILSTKKNRRGT